MVSLKLYRATISIMEPENTNQEVAHATQISRLRQVTPLSKYLAMVLFIILPFVGGWIGYTYALVQVPETQQVIPEESIVKTPHKDIIQSFIADPKKLSNFLNDIENTIVTEELFLQTGTYKTYERSFLNFTDQCHGLVTDPRSNNFWHFKTLLRTMFGNSVNHLDDWGRLVINLPWEQISYQDKARIISGDSVTLELSEREPSYTSAPPCHSFFNFNRIVDDE